MAMLSQRIYVMFAMLSLMIGITGAIYEGTNYNNALQIDANKQEGFETNTTGTEPWTPNTGQASLQYSPTMGNSQILSGAIINIIKYSLNPLSTINFQEAIGILSIIAWGIATLRFILSFIALLDLYMLLFNRKTG